MRRIIYIILILGCNYSDNHAIKKADIVTNNYGESTVYIKSNFREICDTLITTFSVSHHGIGCIRTNTNSSISFDSFQRIISTIKQFDLQQPNCNTYKKTCNVLQATTWISTIDSSVMRKWVYENHDDYIEGPNMYHNKEVVNEYYITRPNKPYNIQMRVTNDNLLLYLRIDEADYSPLYEIIFDPTYNAIKKFDSIKTICKLP